LESHRKVMLLDFQHHPDDVNLPAVRCSSFVATVIGNLEWRILRLSTLWGPLERDRPSAMLIKTVLAESFRI
jgi:hypothetical protein